MLQMDLGAAARVINAAPYSPNGFVDITAIPKLTGPFAQRCTP